MVRVGAGARHGLRYGVLGFVAAIAALAVTADPADARQRRKSRAPAYQPPYASIVIDANSGAVLQATNADSQRHPASLTKIMTLYLLFERLDSGKVKLSSPLAVSAHAADQAPTKLGLKTGTTIAVEDAIKAVVTKSANDAAVVIAEALAGDEAAFAEMMTRKARSLGMTRTIYRNASGLPDAAQVTTAREQALLGRAIQERFPRYYRYFSTCTFVHRGHAMRNHNKLLGKVDGVDGIKTGYTRASGFNLVTSVRRGNRHIVAVVLGGRSGGARDASMRALISAHIGSASTQRTASVLAVKPEPVRTSSRHAAAAAAVTERADPAPTATIVATSGPAPGSSDPIKPMRVKTITYKSAGAQTVTLGRLPAMTAAEPAATMPQIALPFSSPAAPPDSIIAAESARTDAPIAAAPAVPPAPSLMQARGVVAAHETPAVVVPIVRSEPAARPVPKPETSPAAKRPARGGWLIQVGAFPDEGEAKARLQSAKAKAGKHLGAADPFTEPVVRGDKTLYRARFAGFDKDRAEAACKYLKRNDIACMAIRN
jgi:D-alanyl-D-alanine carboxypeptidase